MRRHLSRGCSWRGRCAGGESGGNKKRPGVTEETRPIYKACKPLGGFGLQVGGGTLTPAGPRVPGRRFPSRSRGSELTAEAAPNRRRSASPNGSSQGRK